MPHFFSCSLLTCEALILTSVNTFQQLLIHRSGSFVKIFARGRGSLEVMAKFFHFKIVTVQRLMSIIVVTLLTGKRI